MFVQARRSSFPRAGAAGLAAAGGRRRAGAAAARPARRDRQDRRAARRRDPRRRPRRRRQHPPNIVYDAGDPDSERRARLAFDHVMEAAIALGGTITGEHGVGRAKRGPARPARPRGDGADRAASRTRSTRRASSTPAPASEATARARSVERGGSTSATCSDPAPPTPTPRRPNALSLPLLGHLDPEFLRIMDETCELLRQAWGTTNARTLPLSATGQRRHGGGVRQHRPRRRRRGGRRQRAVRRSGCATWRPGAAPRSSRSSTSGASRSTSSGCSTRTRARRSYAAVHAETSTGVRSDIAALGAAKGDALLVTDAVTSIARHRAARRRLGDRRRLRRHPEVPRRRARPGAVHDQRPRLRAAGREAAQLVPRPGPARRLRRRGRSAPQGRSYLPPHRAGRDGRQPPRRPGADHGGGSRGGLGPPPRGRQAAPGRPPGDGARAVRRRRAAGCPS